MKIKLTLVIALIALYAMADEAVHFYLECQSDQCIELKQQGELVKLEAKPAMSLPASDITKAFYGPTYKGDYELTVDMTPNKAVEFAAITKANLDKKMAFVVENQILLMPVIQGEITGGKFAITVKREDTFKPLEIPWLQKKIEQSTVEHEAQSRQKMIVTWSVIGLLIAGSLAFAFFRK